MLGADEFSIFGTFVRPKAANQAGDQEINPPGSLAEGKKRPGGLCFDMLPPSRTLKYKTYLGVFSTIKV